MLINLDIENITVDELLRLRNLEKSYKCDYVELINIILNQLKMLYQVDDLSSVYEKVLITYKKDNKILKFMIFYNIDLVIFTKGKQKIKFISKVQYSEIINKLKREFKNKVLEYENKLLILDKYLKYEFI